MSVKRPILRYHGGKWLLAPWIISNMPAHRVYTEAYGGAASVLLQKPRAYAEVYNDQWDTLVNIFQVLRDPKLAKRLRRKLELTPFARTEFTACTEARLRRSRSPVEKARLTIFRSYAGHGSSATNALHSTGFRKYNGAANRRAAPAQDWRLFPPVLDAMTVRLQGVIIENKDAREVMTEHDGSDTLHYVDPPYVLATRGGVSKGVRQKYRYELTDGDHRELADFLRGLKGMVMLSGYPCALYEELYEGWHRLDRKARADGARARVECLWFNPAAWNARPQRQLMEVVHDAC